MKTLVYITLCCVASLPATAQMKVGANPTTINAGAILQVDASGSRGAIQLPRVTLTGTADVTTVASPQAGFTVYNTATAGTAPNNVTPGYYYYDGAQWQKILASGNGSTTNIYTADGSLAGNRTVTQGANTLAFNSSAVNCFSVGGTTFSVDAANSRVGIGTATPGYNLDVIGTARVSSLPVSYFGWEPVVVADGAGQLKQVSVSVSGCPQLCAIHEDATHTVPYGTTYYYDQNGNYSGLVILPSSGRYIGDIFTFQHRATSVTTISASNTTMASDLVCYTKGHGASFIWNGNAWMLLTSSGSYGGSNNWSTIGNTGTTAGNYIGTADNADVIFRRYGTQAGLLSYNNNSSWGVGALNPASTGTNNTAIGGYSLALNTTGSANTAIGTIALYNNTTGNNNTATGYYSMVSNTAGNYNVANGLQSMYYNTTGSSNLASGYQSLYNNTTGDNNTATGFQSMFYNTTGNFNVATGLQSLYANGTGIYNSAHGYQALYSNTTGNYNTANGFQSLFYSTGNTNTAFGTNAARNITTGSNNIALGTNTNLPSATADNQLNIGNAIFGTGLNGSLGAPAGNIGIGTVAPSATLDVYNGGSTTIPALKLTTPFSGNATDSILTWNPADKSVRKMATASLTNSTAWGLTGNGGTTGANFIGTTDNVDVVFKRGGVRAGLLGGSNNTSWGAGALNPASTGLNNTAIGVASLINNTTGSSNTATGSSVLTANTSGTGNVASGLQSMTANTIGVNNTATGTFSLFANTTGNNNTATGSLSLGSNTSGWFNTAGGLQSLPSNTSGSSNTALGYLSGNNVTTGSNNIALGVNTNMASGTADNQLNIGNAIFGTGLNGSVGAPAGNIGIGTTAPAATLDVNNGGSTTIPALKLTTPFSGNATDSVLTWNPADKSVRKINASILEPWYNQATNTPATSNTQNIYQAGNVGIGTAPTSKLDVLAGDESATNYIGQGGGANMTIMRLQRLGAFGQSYNPVMDIKITKNSAGQTPNSNSRTLTTFTLAGETSQVPNVDVLTLQASLNQARVGVGVGVPTAAMDITNGGSTTLPALKLTSPFSGAVTDSLLTWNPADNTVRKISPAQVGNTNIKAIATQTTDYNVAAADYTILMDCTAGPLTVTLPAAAGNAGKIIVVSKADETTNTLTYSPALRKSVSTTIASNNAQTTYTLQSNGTDWWIIGKF